MRVIEKQMNEGIPSSRHAGNLSGVKCLLAVSLLISCLTAAQASAFPGDGFFSAMFWHKRSSTKEAPGVKPTVAGPAESGGQEAGDLCRHITLREAMALALENHRCTRAARERIQQAKGRLIQSASEMLPMLSLYGSQTRVGRANLEALGFQHMGMLGPYNTFDGRFQLAQKIFDLSAITRIQEGHTGLVIARLQEDFSRREVMLAASLAYVHALGTDGELKAAQADLDLAQRLWRLARHQQKIGMATRVDVVRAQTRLAEQKVRLQQAKKNRYEAFIQLQRVTGLPFEIPLALADSLRYTKEAAPSVDSSVAAAHRERVEMRIAQEQIRYNRQKLREARLEWLPTFEFSGDYGLNGLKPDRTAREVGEVTFRINVPILEGGRRIGQGKEAKGLVRESRIDYEDLGRQVEEDVRLALQTLEIGIDEVKAARSEVTLANRELEMAKDRFSVGIGDNLEVLGAQAALARARDAYINALVHYQTSRMNLFSALGRPEDFSLRRSELMQRSR